VHHHKVDMMAACIHSWVQWHFNQDETGWWSQRDETRVCILSVSSQTQEGAAKSVANAVQ